MQAGKETKLRTEEEEKMVMAEEKKGVKEKAIRTVRMSPFPFFSRTFVAGLSVLWDLRASEIEPRAICWTPRQLSERGRQLLLFYT